MGADMRYVPKKGKRPVPATTYVSGVLACLLALCVLMKMSNTTGSAAASFNVHHYRDAASMLQGFAAFQQHNMRLLTQATDRQQPLPRVLLVKLPNGGWGNRLPALVTGVLMAALTNRTLMVDPGPSFYQYVELAVGADWRQHGAPYASATRCSVVNMQLASQGAQWCPSGADAPSHDVLEYLSWDYDVPLLQVNPEHAAVLAALFPTGNVYHQVSKFLFRPAPLVVEAMAPYEHLAASCAVGMHVRSTKPFPMQGREAPKAFPLEHFASVAKGLAQGRPGTMFVAADADVFGTLAAQLPGRAVWWSNVTQATIGQNAATGKNPGTDLSAVTDMFLLTRCKQIVVTSGSSFGFVAAAMADVKPVAIAPYQHDSPFDQPWFWGSVTSEPCCYGLSDTGMAKVPAGVAAALRSSHPLFLFHNQCHP